MLVIVSSWFPIVHDPLRKMPEFYYFVVIKTIKIKYSNFIKIQNGYKNTIKCI